MIAKSKTETIRKHTQMTTPSIKPYKPLFDWFGLAMRLIYLGGFLFGLHTQLINFADDILWVKVLGYLSMLPLLKWIVRETGIQARGLSASVAQEESSLVLNSGAQALHLHADSRTSIHACRILSGVDVKIDNTRLWFPSGHPAYVWLRAQQEAGVGFSEHRGPMRSFWVAYGIAQLTLLATIGITYLIASSG